MRIEKDKNLFTITDETNLMIKLLNEYSVLKWKMFNEKNEILVSSDELKFNEKEQNAFSLGLYNIKEHYKDFDLYFIILKSVKPYNADVTLIFYNEDGRI